MTICYLMGGFFESDLGYETGLGVAWLDLSKLILGSFGELRLAFNGVDPGPPDGVALRPAGPLTPYVLLPGAQLAIQLRSAGYTIGFFGWDWRKEIYDSGILLAARVRREVGGGDPCTLIGHSAGGLVCRAAWTELVRSGEQGLVRRVICVGTPHWGSYVHVGVWSGVSAQLDQILQLNQIVGYPASRFPAITGYRYWTANQVIRLTMTWPCLYELLPVVGAPDSGNDPDRQQLYVAGNWPSAARPTQFWLDYSNINFRAWLNNPQSVPPSNVLTCVSGRGHSTYNRLVDPAQLGTMDALGSTQDGDGTVTQASAQLGGQLVEVVCDHASLIPNLVNDGTLAELVLAERAPPPAPPPPAEVETDPMLTVLIGPPLTAQTNIGGMSAACSLGRCEC